MSHDEHYAVAQLAVLLSILIKVQTRRHNTISIGEQGTVDHIHKTNEAVMKGAEEHALKSFFDIT